MTNGRLLKEEPMHRFLATFAPLTLPLTLACGQAAPSSHLAGKAGSDAVTAKLRDTFGVAMVPAQMDLGRIVHLSGWDCTYHASTTQVVFRGFSDVQYHSTFTSAGVLIAEEA